MTLNNPAAGQQTQFMINSQVRRYNSDLSSWASRVEGTRINADAFRAACQRPQPGHFIRSLRYLYNAEEVQANNRVQRNLEARIKDMKRSDPGFPILLRLSRGHWPDIYRKLESIQKSQSA